LFIDHINKTPEPLNYIINQISEEIMDFGNESISNGIKGVPADWFFVPNPHDPLGFNPNCKTSQP
jgi:hypothetical protein